jgi:hypothetical protein
MYIFTGRKLPYWTKMGKKPNWWPSNVEYRNVNWGQNKPRLNELVQIMQAFNRNFEDASSRSGDDSHSGSDDEEYGESEGMVDVCSTRENADDGDESEGMVGCCSTRENADDGDELLEPGVNVEMQAGFIDEIETENIKRQVMV